MDIKEFKPSEWHDFRVLVEGNRHRHWIDGHLTVDVIDLDEKGRKLEGILGMQVHVGPKMTIEYKDLYLKKLADDLPLITAAQAPIPADAVKVVPQGKDNKKSKEQKQPASKEEAREVIGTIERLDPRFDELIPKDAKLEKIAEGFIWTEGAAWYKPGKCLFFSDIPNNVVIKWEPGKGTSEYLKPSGYTGEKPRGGKPGDEPGSNGLFVDAQGRLHLCEHGDRRVTRIEKDGKKTVMADNYMGKRLNSPNDLALHSNGDVYFTDPPYGLAKGDKRELDFTGVFRISGKDGTISLVSKSLSPNGIALSPDLKKLYVTNGGSWMVFPVNEDGTTGEGKLFVSPKQWKLTPAKGGGVDGLKCDAKGNIFATGPGGVCVIAPDGTLLGRLLTGDRTANLCFGGEDGQTLFVCVNHRIGMVRTTTKGIGW
jgi:gluconolactonase